MEFKHFNAAVGKQFQSMSKNCLFVVDVDKDQLWDTYLSSFPEGSNPIYKTRTEHDCNCCRHFIRAMGGVVTIDNSRIVTLWDINVDFGTFYPDFPKPFQKVADAMASLVRSQKLLNIFLHTEKTAGTANSRQLLEDKSVKTWDHFFLNLPSNVVVNKDQIGPKLSDARGAFDLFYRGLQTISLDALDTILDLIGQNSLYRGEEHQNTVKVFRTAKIEFDQLKAEAREPFAWYQSVKLSPAVARIRNSAIGSLLLDLSEGKMELEDAVKSFEAKVAPANYKRPTALITKDMIRKAQEKIEELGLTTALERRYATIEDITINNILFANRQAKKAMNVFDELAGAVPESTKKLDKVEEVGIEDFLSKILPKAESVEVMFENRHTGNLVSLIAPADPTAKQLLKWPNNFSWSYTGEVTDSIKERVKAAGGSVTGDLCCRLAWDYTDDLDFHMDEPGGYKIYFPNRRKKSPCGGELDLDANGADGIRSDPAENIFYTSRNKMREGTYILSVNNYNRRSSGQGFTVEIEFDGQTHQIPYAPALRSGQTLEVARIVYSKTDGFKIVSSLLSSQTSKTVWNLPTQTFHPVNVLMLSPNYWNEKAVGNKHYFFMLNGCRNQDKARGFFNEFLTEDLAAHRKVFEVVGSKMKTEESDRQLSGLGFSSTQRNNVLCRVKGSFTRTVKVVF